MNDPGACPMKQRSTRQRRLVFDAVQAMREHPTADHIYLKVRGENPRISRGTVYRNLNLLVENGEVRHVRVPGVDRFDWRTDRHYHVICTRCGRVVDAPVPYDGSADDAIARCTGFEITGHIKVFEGLCPQCRAGSEQDAEGAALERPPQGQVP